jgi:hypothetical protein
MQEPFKILPELKDDTTNVRFTKTSTAFYIISLIPPVAPAWTIAAPLPILPGDRVRLLGSDEDVSWSCSTVSTSFALTDEMVRETGRDIAWVIEVQYGGTLQPSSHFRDEL